jgi:hypothetical protein
MNERWKWVVRYLVVIALAVILALVLGEMSLFKATRIGKTGLNAARIVQFLGFGGALLVLWLAAQRAAAVLPAHDRRWGVVKSVLLPLTTLIVVAAGQAVALLLLGPVMSKTWHEVYNWIAIAAITLSAAWLLIALFTGSSSLAPLLGNGRSRA